MLEPIIVREKILKEELIHHVRDGYYSDASMIKVDVDVKRGILTIGGEWHSEGEALLVRDGSINTNVWGCNFHPWENLNERIAYTSLINIKPNLGYTAMEIKNMELQEKMSNIIRELLLRDDETLSSE